MSPQYKRGRYYNAYSGGAKLKPKVAPVVKEYVKKCTQMLLDTKFFDQQYSNTNLTSTATIQTWAYGVIQGTGVNQRVGQKIKINYFDVKYFFSDTAQARVRVIFFVDRMPGGAAPSMSDIVTGSSIEAPYNHYNVIGAGGSRFQILHDKRVNIQPLITATSRCYNGGFRRKMDTVVRYDGNAGTVSDMVANNIGYMVWSDGTTADFAVYSYFKYTDT